LRESKPKICILLRGETESPAATLLTLDDLFEFFGQIPDFSRYAFQSGRPIGEFLVFFKPRAPFVSLVAYCKDYPCGGTVVPPFTMQHLQKDVSIRPQASIQLAVK
jgi:hypothetical protein